MSIVGDALMIERLLEDLDGHIEQMAQRLDGIKQERAKLVIEEANLKREIRAAHNILRHSTRVVAKALGKLKPVMRIAR
jgi:hypothetical protein